MLFRSNRQSDIEPVLVAKKISDKQSNTYQRLIDSFSRFNQANKNRSARLKFVEFDLQNNDIVYVSTAGIARWSRFVNNLVPSVQGVDTVDQTATRQ